MITGIIRTDSVLIDQSRYFVDGGVVVRKRIFPEQQVEITRENFVTKYSDLHPYINTYEIRDMSQGLGQYIDDADGVEKQFSRKAWFSTLNHSLEDVMVIADRRQAAGQIPRVRKITPYRNFILALTDGGLYKFDTGTQTFTAVTGSPTTPMYDAVIHREWLFIARGAANPVLRWDGTEAAANFTVPNASEFALLVTDLDDRLFIITARNTTTGLINVRYSENVGVAYSPAIVTGGVEGGLPTPSDPHAVLIAPDADNLLQVYVSTTNAVWIVDYRVGKYALFHDMNNSISDFNGYVLALWPSTRKIYVNERAVLVEIDPSTGETNVVGPEMNTIPPLLPQGLPDNPPRKASGLVAFTYNSNYFFVGTQPNSSSDFSTILKMTPDHKWYFVQHHAEANMPVRSMMLSGLRLYFAEDISASASDQARFLDFGGEYAEEGEAHTPWLTMGLPGIEKCFYELLIEAKNFGGGYIFVGYRTNFDESSTTNLAIIDGSTASPYHRVLGTVPHNLGIEAKAIKFIIKIVRETGVTTTSPQFLNLKIRWRPHPEPVDMYEMVLNLDKGVDRMSDLVDLISRLDASFSGKCAVSFIPSGDSADAAPLMVIPVGHDVSLDWEQLRNTGKVKLSLVVVTVDDGVGSAAAPEGFIRLWVVYAGLALRRMNLNSATGAFDSWATDPITTGFANAAGEVATAIACKPNANTPVYVATRDNTNLLRLYRYDGATLSVVHTIATAANVDITSIHVAQNSTKVFFGVGDRSGSVLGNQTYNGIYYAADGLTFSRMSSGIQTGDSTGVQFVFYNEFTDEVWTAHWANSGVKVISYSGDNGTTMTDVDVALIDPDAQTMTIQGFPYLNPTNWIMAASATVIGANPQVRVATNPKGTWNAIDGIALFSGQEGIFVDASHGIRAHVDVNANSVDWWMTSVSAFKYGNAVSGPFWTSGGGQRIAYGCGFTFHWTKKWVVFCGANQSATVHVLTSIDNLIEGSHQDEFFAIAVPANAQAVAFVPNAV